MADEPWRNDDYFVSPWNYREEVTSGFTPPVRVAVHDVTLRDGEQQAGVDRIEAGLPAVSPADMEAATRIAAAGLPSRVFAFSRCMVSDVELPLEDAAMALPLEPDEFCRPAEGVLAPSAVPS